MDNFDLHKYLKNNPLLVESVEGKTTNKVTKSQIKDMVREMVGKETTNTPDETNLGKAVGKSPNVVAKLSLINQPTELDGTFKLVLDYSELKNISKSTIMAALKRAMDELSPDSQTVNTIGDPVEPMMEGEEINEMARIAKPSKLADNWEGPALITPNGKKEYYIHGIQYTEENYKEALRNRTGIPPMKDPRFKTRL